MYEALRNPQGQATPSLRVLVPNSIASMVLETEPINQEFAQRGRRLSKQF